MPPPSFSSSPFATSKKAWARGVKDWNSIYNQLIIYFGADRLNLEDRGAGRAQNS